MMSGVVQRYRLTHPDIALVFCPLGSFCVCTPQLPLASVSFFPLTYSVDMIEEIGREGRDVVHSFHHLCDTRRGLVCVMGRRYNHHQGMRESYSWL